MIKRLSLILLLTGMFTVFFETASFARGGFSSGGRSFSSGGRSYGGYRSYSGGYRSYGGYYGGGYRSGGVFICGGGGLTLFIVFGIMMALVIIVSLAKRGKNVSTPGMGTLIKLQVAFFADKQGKIRQEITRIGKSSNVSSPSGLAALLNQIMIFIGRNIENISHYHFQSSAKQDIGALVGQFEQLASAEKMKYDTDSDGTGQNTTPDEMEIQQHVVLTVIAATERVDLQGIQIVDQHQLRDAVNKLAGISARSLYAVEVIVTPADVNDALSRETLEMEFPELKML